VQNKKKSEIALTIGVSKSTVTRETQRNSDERSHIYPYKLAQSKSEKRKQEKPKKTFFSNSMKIRVRELIEKEYSPEQITGFCRRHNKDMVSHERIYQYILADKKIKGTLFTFLRCKGRRYRKRGAYKDPRGIIINRIDIDKWPKDVEKREVFGGLEADTIVGKDHKRAIVTINDRSTGMLKMKKVNTREAAEVEQAIIELLEDWSPFNIRTMTVDNGKEFANHQSITKKTEVDIYFAKPYHSWQRGSNENLNGLIRQYIPKKTDFSLISDEYICYVENKIKNRPRKR
jgi:IS30 family transposase